MIILNFSMKSNSFSFSRINFNTLSMLYAQYMALIESSCFLYPQACGNPARIKNDIGSGKPLINFESISCSGLFNNLPFSYIWQKSLPRFDLEILLLLPIIELLQQFEDYAKGIASKKGKNVIIRK